jgi:hypothetical protein
MTRYNKLVKGVIRNFNNRIIVNAHFPGYTLNLLNLQKGSFIISIIV